MIQRQGNAVRYAGVHSRHTSSVCRLRLQRIGALKGGNGEALPAAAPGTFEGALDTESILAEAALVPRKRKLNVADILEPSLDDEGDSSAEDGDINLDWRAKTH